MKGPKNRRGFSLVELIIVIVILGVIAAIAIPRISRGAKGADESAVRQDLGILRTAVEMFMAEHSGLYPGNDGTEATFTDQLLKYSDKQGNTSDTKTGNYIYGPYLRKQLPPLPVGPQAGQRGVKIANTGPAVDEAASFGWVYNYATGNIIANCDDATEAEPNTTFDQW